METLKLSLPNLDVPDFVESLYCCPYDKLLYPFRYFPVYPMLGRPAWRLSQEHLNNIGVMGLNR